jgi:putative hydrolase of the HAD superfamily
MAMPTPITITTPVATRARTPELIVTMNEQATRQRGVVRNCYIVDARSARRYNEVVHVIPDRVEAQPLQTLLLDLDDTLLDYSGGADACWTAACHAGGASAGLAGDSLVQAVAEVRRWFWEDPARQRRERVNMLKAWQTIVSHALDAMGLPGRDDVAAAVARDFAARRRQRMQLFEDALDTLQWFRARGVPLGLVTNGDAGQQRDKIERFDLARFFDVIVIEGEFGAGKPDEVVYRHALEALGARADRTWMVGDHLEFDVHGSQRLGMCGIWVDRDGTGLPAGSAVQPQRIIRSLRELC